MSSLEEDINLAQETIESNQSYVDRFQRIYPFATENVPGCLSFYDFLNKDCLTVLGSSSQMLYMYLNNAKSVTTFDINKLTLYYFYFIKAFISSGLNKEKLVDLFVNNKPNNSKTFDKISKHIEGDSNVFWNTLFDKYGPDLFNDYRLFNYGPSSKKSIFKTSIYLNEKELKKLRDISDSINPNFINCNIKDLGDMLNSKYDLIYLSNIIQYVNHNTLYGSSTEKIKSLTEYKMLLYNLSSHLKEKGSLIGSYIYELDDTCSKIPIFDKPSRDKVFNGRCFDYHTFDSYTNFEFEDIGFTANKKDACLILKK